MTREPFASIIGGIALALIICAACVVTTDHPEQSSTRKVCLPMPAKGYLKHDIRAILKSISGDGCVEWPGGKSSGYGMVFEDSASRAAHAVAFKIANGPIPPGMCVCHKCDNPPCINPKHLFLGTRQQNNKDRDEKGRTVGGCDHPKSKFIDAQVREIRTGNLSSEKLAVIYGVAPSTIYRIRNRTSYRRA